MTVQLMTWRTYLGEQQQFSQPGIGLACANEARLHAFRPVNLGAGTESNRIVWAPQFALSDHACKSKTLFRQRVIVDTAS